MTTRKLITIVTELSLENTLTRALEAFKISGYTILDARGKGSRGDRGGGWDASRNIRVEVVCESDVATEINNMLKERFYDNFAMISFTQDVTVLRPDKF